MTQLPADVKLVAGDGPQGTPQGLVLEIKEGWLFSVVGGSFVRTPLSHYSADDVAKIKQNIEQFKSAAMEASFARYSLSRSTTRAGQFGGDRSALMFRGFQHPQGPNFNGQKFLMPKDLLAAGDQARAEELLKSKKIETPLALADAPRVWYPLMHLQEQAAEPVSINGKMFTFRLQRRAPGQQGFQTADATAFDERQSFLDNLSPEDVCFRCSYWKKSVCGLPNQVSPMPSWPKLCISSPILLSLAILSCIFRPRLQLRLANRPMSALLAAWSAKVVPIGFFEVQGPDNKPMQFAFVKSELAADYVEYGERVLKDLQSFFSSHSEIKPPELQTKLRLLRTNNFIAQGEPVAIDNETVELRVPDPAGPRSQKFPLKSIHFKDVEDIRVLLGSAPTKVIRHLVLPQPLGPRGTRQSTGPVATANRTGPQSDLVWHDGGAPRRVSGLARICVWR